MRWEQDLVKDIRYHDSRDDIDWNDGVNFGQDIPFYPVNVHRDFSALNQELLLEQFLPLKNTSKFIMEIGVCRHENYWYTSTSVLLENKEDDCVYLGVDIEPKTYLESKAPSVHTIQTRSENFSVVRDKIKSLGATAIDILVIDGWHSINQVLLEWEYTDLLSDRGLVVFHDTKQHPGPYLFIRHLDKSKWDVIENACTIPNDFGIGFAKKK